MPTNTSRLRRIAITAVLALTMLVAFASLGGISVATSAIGAAQYQYGKKVTICHKGKTITVAKAALKAHRKHGDTVGPCTAAQKSKAAAAKAKGKAKADAARAKGKAKADAARAKAKGKADAEAKAEKQGGPPAHRSKPVDKGHGPPAGKGDPGHGKGRGK